MILRVLYMCVGIWVVELEDKSEMGGAKLAVSGHGGTYIPKYITYFKEGTMLEMREMWV